MELHCIVFGVLVTPLAKLIGLTYYYLANALNNKQDFYRLPFFPYFDLVFETYSPSLNIWCDCHRLVGK